jgi:hypothetical protein
MFSRASIRRSEVSSAAEAHPTRFWSAAIGGGLVLGAINVIPVALLVAAAVGIGQRMRILEPTPTFRDSIVGLVFLTVLALCLAVLASVVALLVASHVARSTVRRVATVGTPIAVSVVVLSCLWFYGVVPTPRIG